MTLLWMSIDVGGDDPKWDQPLAVSVSGTTDTMGDCTTANPITRSTVYLHAPMEDPFHGAYLVKHNASGLRDHWRDLRSYDSKFFGKKGHLQYIPVIEGRILSLFDTRGVAGPLTLAGADVGGRVLPYLKVWMPNLVDRLTEHTFDTSLIRRLLQNDNWPPRCASDVMQALDEGFGVLKVERLLEEDRHGRT